MTVLHLTSTLLVSDANHTQDLPDPFISSMGDSWDLVIGVTILFIVISGVFLNIIVLWTLVKHKTGQNHHLNNTDYYIIALASSDLLAVVLCYPLTFVSTMSHRWLFGDVGCSINGFFGFLFSTVDVGVLSTMSIVRMLSVKMPHCALVKQPRYTMLTLVGVVIYALVWTAAPLFGWGDYAPEPFGTSCTVAWKSPDRSYVTAVFTGVLAVPLVVMLVCYGCVVYHMSLSSSRVERYVAERKRRAKRQHRLVRMAVLMCVCFLIIWLPYSVLSICFAYIPAFDVHPVQSAIPTVLAKISHVINPVIYFTMNPSYRRRVKCLSCWRTVSSPASRAVGGKLTEDCPADRSSDQPTALPMSTYITPSPIMPHTASTYTPHTAQSGEARIGGDVTHSSDYETDSEGHQVVTCADLCGAPKITKDIQNIIMTLEKANPSLNKNNQDGAGMNEFRNAETLNNAFNRPVNTSGPKLLLILDTCNFKRSHKDFFQRHPEIDINYAGIQERPTNMISSVDKIKETGEKKSRLSCINQAANSNDFVDETVKYDSCDERDKVSKKLVGAVFVTKENTTIDNKLSYSNEQEPLCFGRTNVNDVINSNEFKSEETNVRHFAPQYFQENSVDQNENLESFVSLCPVELEQLLSKMTKSCYNDYLKVNT